jgi:hypothetical protein
MPVAYTKPTPVQSKVHAEAKGSSDAEGTVERAFFSFLFRFFFSAGSRFLLFSFPVLFQACVRRSHVPDSALSSDTDEEALGDAAALSLNIPLLLNLLKKIAHGSFDRELTQYVDALVMARPHVEESDSGRPNNNSSTNNNSNNSNNPYSRSNEKQRSDSLVPDPIQTDRAPRLAPVNLPRTTFLLQNGSDSDEYNTYFSSIEVVVEALERLDGLAMTVNSEEYFRILRERRIEAEKEKQADYVYDLSGMNARKRVLLYFFLSILFFFSRLVPYGYRSYS